MKILLLGKDGQVGWELQRSLELLGEVVSLGRHGDSQFCGDLSNPSGVAESVRAIRPDVIVNAAAYTAVDQAENENDLVHLINAVTPSVLAQEAKELNALLVHFSTDYVFDGSGILPRFEKEAMAPLSVYGRSKQEAEQLIEASGCQYLILRTGWVYAARGANFVKTILRIAQERERLTVINDQWGAPTGAELLADVTAHAIRYLQHHPEASGLYHCVAAGETTWYAYAKYIIETAKSINPEIKIKAQWIEPISTSDFFTAAKRPLNSRLHTEKLQTTFGLTLPHWQHGVRRMLNEIL